MGFKFVVSLLVSLLILGGANANVSVAAGPETLSSYRLAAGDLVNVAVLGEPDLKIERVRLSDAGTLSFPILGELKVLGMTVGDLERTIADGLRGRYLVDPRVTVSILEYRSFYVTGQVNKPGPYPYVPGLNVRKAISLAGDFKERADPGKIFIIRDNDPTQTPRRVNLNSTVNPGDILTVQESFF